MTYGSPFILLLKYGYNSLIVELQFFDQLVNLTDSVEGCSRGGMYVDIAMRLYLHRY